MRIVAGRWGGRVLKAPVGDTTRPTLDAHRETLFNVLVHRGFLNSDDGALRIFDLFAGTGALSFEALSRCENIENSRVVFFENNKKAIEVIRQNAQNLMESKASAAIDIVSDLKFEKWPQRILDRQKSAFCPVDLIFCDPPYKKNLVLKSLKFLESTLCRDNILSKQAILVVECEKEFSPSDLLKQLSRWTLEFEKSLGITQFLILKRQ
jgi:16S rRNA (guanine966-N2)-methyltransferase